MKSKLLFGAAGIALFAATGATQAADVPMMPTTTPAAPPVAAAGPAIEFTARLNGGFLFIPCCEYYIEAETEGVIDFQRPAGWSFQLLGWHEYYPGGYDYDLYARAYRNFGGLTVGVYVGTDDLFDWTDLVPGVDFAFMRGALTVYNNTYAHFDAFHFHSDTRVEYAFSDRLMAYGEVELTFLNGPFVYIDYVKAGAELDLGNITPYAYLHWEPGSTFWGFDIGARLERPIGTGPLSLIAEADIGIHPGYYIDIEASIGIRFARGEVNSPWWW